MSTCTERRRSYMTAECLIVQHVAAEPPGLIEEAVVAAGMTARTVRVFAAEPVPTDATGFRGLVVMGGPMGVADVGRLPHLRAEMTLIESALKHDIPVMGVCLGSQLLAAVLGSRVTPGPAKEIGWHPVTLLDGGQRDRLLTAAPPRFNAFHWHGDVFDLPPGAVALARSERTPLQAFRYGERAYGFLFHLEVTEAIVGQMVGAFPDELAEAGIDGDTLRGDSRTYLPELQPVARSVFSKWARLGT